MFLIHSLSCSRLLHFRSRRKSCCRFLVSATMAFAVAAAATAVDSRQDRAEKEFKKTVSELLETLAEGNLLAPANARTKRAILKGVLDALDCDAALAPPESVNGTPPTEKQPLNRYEVVGGVYCYIQLTTVTEIAARALKERLGDSAFGHYDGLVLDLRCARDGDAAAVQQAAAAIAASHLPAALLIAPETRGAAELLAARLRGKRHTALLGQATAGLPFGWRQKKLSTGDALLLPRPPPPGENRNSVPVQPDVTVTQSVPVKLLLDSDRELDVDKDACLRRALDLLSAMAVFDPEDATGPKPH